MTMSKKGSLQYPTTAEGKAKRVQSSVQCDSTAQIMGTKKKEKNARETMLMWSREESIRTSLQKALKPLSSTRPDRIRLTATRRPAFDAK